MDLGKITSVATPMSLDLVFAVAMGYTLYPMPPTLAMYFKTFGFRVLLTTLFLLRTRGMLFGGNSMRMSTALYAAAVAFIFQYLLQAWAEADAKKYSA